MRVAMARGRAAAPRSARRPPRGCRSTRRRRARSRAPRATSRASSVGAAQLEARAGPGRRPEHHDHPPARGVVGLDELDARAPEAGLDEAPAHRLARRLRLLLPVALPRPRAGERVRAGPPADGVARTRPARSRRARCGPPWIRNTASAHRAACAGPRARRAPRAGRGAPAPGPRRGRRARGARARAGRRAAAGRCARSPRRRSRDRPRPATATSSGAGTGRNTTSIPGLALAPHQLDAHVLEATGGEDQLDRAPHRLGVERAAGRRARRTR